MEIIKSSAAAKLLGVTTQTLRNWERRREVVPARISSGGRRYYYKSTILALLHQPDEVSGAANKAKADGKVLAYLLLMLTDTLESQP